MTMTDRCAEFRALAADLIEGAAAPSPATSHQAGCDECRAYVADLRSLQESLRALQGPAAPAELWPRIEERLSDRPAQGPARILRFAAAACAAGLFAVVALLSHDASARDSSKPRSRIALMPMEMSAAEETEDSVVDPLARMLLSSASFDEK
jgi:hypothetical protein